MALPEGPNAPGAWWVRFDDYALRDGVVWGLGNPRVVPMWELLEPVERVPAFAAFAGIETPQDCVGFARQYSLLGLFSYRHPFLAFIERTGVSESGFEVRVMDRRNIVSPWGSAIKRLLDSTKPTDLEKPWEGVWEYDKGGMWPPRGFELIDSSRQATPLVDRIGSLPVKEAKKLLPTSGMNRRLYEGESVADWLFFAREMRDALQSSDPENVARRVTQELRGLRLTVKARPIGGFAFEWAPSSLLAGLWLQVAQHLTGGASLRQCANCGRLFVPDDPRVKYCSRRCKVQRDNKKARGKLDPEPKEAKQDAKGKTGPR